MKGKGGLEDVLAKQSDVQITIQITKVPIISQEQLKPQKPINLDSIEYMPIQITSQSIDYGTPITTLCNSPKDGDNGHTKTIEEAEQLLHQQIPYC